MKKTKIICTLGPKTNDLTTVLDLIHNGMNVARINMSHSDYSFNKHLIDLVKISREKLNVPISIMVDTKGPEIRIGRFKNGKIFLKEKDKFTFTTKEVLGNQERVTISYKKLPLLLKKNDKIYASNGQLVFKVINILNDEIETKVLFGGELSDRKSINIPNIVQDKKYLSNQDKEDLLFAIENGANYIAASFVSNKQNVLDLRKFLDSNNGQNIKIISKIENGDGVKNIKEIINVSDGIMVARGDLGVEIPLVKIPAIQKNIISLCNENSKIVIVATEMLESMIKNIRPTRAEVSDVANSIFDLTSSTMLSGETAVGIKPCNSVKYMKDIIIEAEKRVNRFDDFKSLNKLDILTKDLQLKCKNEKIKKLIIVSNDENLYLSLSKYHNDIIIYAFVTDKTLFNNLSLFYNINPIYFNEINNKIINNYINNKLNIKNNKYLLFNYNADK